MTADVVFFSLNIRHTAVDWTSMEKYFVVHSLLSTRHSLSTFLFFGPLIFTDGLKVQSDK